MKNDKKENETKETQYSFVTSLSCEAVVDIISKLEASPWGSGICGKSDGKQIEISYFPTMRHPYMPIFGGTISEKSGGTVISGCFQVPRFSRIFPKVYKRFTIFMFLIALIFGNIDIIGMLYIFLILSTMFVGMTFLEKSCKAHGEEEKIMVFNFIEKELYAIPQDQQHAEREVVAAIKSNTKENDTERTEYRFSTSLSYEAIADIILKKKVPFWGIGICGKSLGKQIEISYISYISVMKNPVNPVFYGTVSNNSDGTVISGCFQVPKFSKGFLGINFVLMILGLIPCYIFSQSAGMLFMVLPLLIMIGSAFCVKRMCRLQGEEAKIRIVRFIEKELFATPQDDQSS